MSKLTLAMALRVPANKAVPVSATATGRLLSLEKLFGSSSVFALAAGTNANLQLDSGDGIKAVAALGAGVSQDAIVQVSDGDKRMVQYKLTCTGAPTKPAVPTVALTAGNGQISVSWVDGSNGGSPITSHNIYDNGVLIASPTGAGPYVITGLPNGTPHGPIQVTAVNLIGESDRSAPQSATPNSYGLISDVQIMANLTDIATVTKQPVTSGDIIPLYTMGWVLKVTTSSPVAIDPLKVVVNVSRPGFNNKVATTRVDTAIGTGLLRRCTPNDATALPAGTNSFYVTLDNMIFGPDTVVSVSFLAGFYSGSPQIDYPGGSITRNDSLSGGVAYPQPIVRIAALPFQVTNSTTPTVAIDVTGVSNFARSGRQFDTVEAWCRVGGVDGPAVATQTMQRSRHTPSSGRLPGKPLPAYLLDPSAASLADGAGGVRIRVYPFCGPVWESWVSGTAFPTANVEAEFPFINDQAGKYSPVYAWVNQDGTAATYFDGSTISNQLTVSAFGGGAAIGVGTVIYSGSGKRTITALGTGTGGTGTYTTAEFGTINSTRWSTGMVQTTTADPGASASFATMACAQAAISAYNAARTGGLAHSDPDGGVLMFRDVAGSTLGAAAGSYSCLGYSLAAGTLVPLEFRAASGATSQLCRFRGTKPDNSSAGLNATYRQITGRVRFRNINFDGTNVTAANDNIVFSGLGGQGLTKATTTSHLHLIDCDLNEYASAGASTGVLSGFGWRNDFRVNQTPVFATNASGYTSSYQCFVRAIGSAYSHPAPTALFVPFVGGCLMSNVGLGSQGNSDQVKITLADGGEIVDGYTVINTRLDMGSGAASIVTLDTRLPLTLGYGFLNVMARQAGTPNATGFRLGGDASTGTILNGVIHHSATDGGIPSGTSANSLVARWNYGYNDQLFGAVVKYIQKVGCVLPSANNKTDTFLAGESMEVPVSFAAGVRFYPGEQVNDGNATVASRLYYRYIGPTGQISVAGDLSNTALWQPIGNLSGQLFGRNPIRTGNWAIRNAVGDLGNVIANSADGALTLPLPTNGFAPEKLGRGGGLATDYTTYYKNPTGGGTFTVSQLGDYRPKSIAAGDAVDSPLLNRIPSGAAVVPFDLDGNARLNDGTGAAGPYERAA